jgi:hypothetical protein
MTKKEALLFGGCEGGGFWPKKSDLILSVHKETIHELNDQSSSLLS